MVYEQCCTKDISNTFSTALSENVKMLSGFNVVASVFGCFGFNFSFKTMSEF